MLAGYHGVENEMSNTPVDLSNKKILVTGPTSQVAVPLMEHLVKISPEIYGLARFSKESDRKIMESLGVKVIAKDLATDSLDDIPDDFDYVLHFAVVKTGDFVYDLKANAEGSGRLVAHCHKAKAFLLASSGGVYQYAGHDPLPETAPLGDNHRALLPTYSICKIAQETVTRFAAKEHNVPTIIGRMSLPYGDNGGWPFYHLMMMKEGIPIDVHPEQPNFYNPIHADDYIKQIPHLLAAATTDTLTVNWAGQQKASIEEWCAYLTELTGYEPKFNLTEKAFGSLSMDITELEKIYDEPTLDWKEGIKRMVSNLMPDALKN
jgi:nucleoside-diphosphate-sugar epimerase